MPNTRKSACTSERVLENLQQTRPSISQVQLRPGDKVVVYVWVSYRNSLYGRESRNALCRRNLGKRYHYSRAVVVKESELIPAWL
jgi:hypothetical protein